MTRLSDIQLILLTTASQRDDGSLLPPAQSVAVQAARIAKAVPPLLKRKLAIESEAANPALAWRQDGERHLGLFITDAGRAAIGSEAAAPSGDDAQPPAEVEEQGGLEPISAKPATKSAQVVALLQRTDGATLDELVAATGWLPHTTRAALTGLRKKGHVIVKGKRGDKTCYTLPAAA